MGMMEAIQLFFQNYTNFEGRSRRAEYWWVVLANLIIALTALLLVVVIGGGLADLNILGLLFGAIMGLYGLAILIPSIALGVRRFHDLDQTGWLFLVFMVLGLIPLIGFLAVIAQYIWLAMPGTTGPNKYGPDPKSGHDVGVFN
ncbi:MAG: DUF805 domain-containing protein [Pseudomonadota bacterium]